MNVIVLAEQHNLLSCISMGHCRAVLDSFSLDLLSVNVVAAVRESFEKIARVSFKGKNYGSTVHLIMIVLDRDSVNHRRTA